MAGPWNHVDPQVSRYSPGYVAFAPSPGPAAAQYADEMLGVSFGAPSPSGSNRSGRSRERKKNHSKSPAKGKSKARLLGWEHTTVLNGGLTLVVENTEAPPHRSGVRRGKLDPEAAEKARKIRKLRACWNCWIQKIPVSLVVADHVWIFELNSISARKERRAINAEDCPHRWPTSSVVELVLKIMLRRSSLVNIVPQFSIVSNISHQTTSPRISINETSRISFRSTQTASLIRFLTSMSRPEGSSRP